MIEIPKSNLGNILTFRDPKKVDEFKEKYKDLYPELVFSSKIVTDDDYKRTKLFDLEDDKWYSLVKDWGSRSRFCIAIEGSKTFPLAPLYYRQFPGMCGAVVIYDMTFSNYTIEHFKMIESFLFLLGYAMIFTSQQPDQRLHGDSKHEKYSQLFEELKYIPFLGMYNRRTASKVNFYYKQLEL